MATFSDEVIGLLKGTKKHMFPVEQFIDGRPARGIFAIVGLAGGHRVAWPWLRQANPVLSGRKPWLRIRDGLCRDDCS